MNSLIRPAIVVGVAGILVLAILGLDLSCAPVNFWAAQEEREELRQLERATFDRDEARQHILREWIARRCTLGEVLTRFQVLDREWPDYTTEMAEKWSGENRQYQQILSTVETVLAGRPEELAAVIARLEKELQQLLADRKEHRSAPADPRAKRSR